MITKAKVIKAELFVFWLQKNTPQFYLKFHNQKIFPLCFENIQSNGLFPNLPYLLSQSVLTNAVAPAKPPFFFVYFIN